MVKDKKKNGAVKIDASEPVKEQLADKAEPEREEPGYRVNGREGPQDGSAEKRSTGTVAIKLTEDGAADPGTRENTWKRLAEMLERTPGAKARLLGGKEASGLIDPESVEPFYTGIGLINTFLAIRLLKMEAAIAGDIIPYSPQELQLLSEATADAVNENLGKCPQWLLDLLRGGGSVAFAKLAMVLFQVHAAKFQAVRQVMGQPQEKRQAIN